MTSPRSPRTYASDGHRLRRTHDTRGGRHGHHAQPLSQLPRQRPGGDGVLRGRVRRKVNVATFADYHASTDPSEDDLVLHADLEAASGIRFMGADVPNRMEYTQGTHFSMT